MNLCFNPQTTLTTVRIKRVGHLPSLHSGFATSDSGHCGKNGGAHVVWCEWSSFGCLEHLSPQLKTEEVNNGKFWDCLITEQQGWRHSSHKDLIQGLAQSRPWGNVLSESPLPSLLWMALDVCIISSVRSLSWTLPTGYLPHNGLAPACKEPVLYHKCMKVGWRTMSLASITSKHMQTFMLSPSLIWWKSMETVVPCWDLEEKAAEISLI